ncbi:MAG TPA: hypothetical protein VN174_03005 [Candidatus Methanoperedens sp.]|nr:hypothetical protein [Candidatus Methanoperedens sp.]
MTQADMAINDRKEIVVTSQKVFITQPLAAQSLDTVIHITDEIRTATGSEFSRSNQPQDSFYPRMTLLALEDVRADCYPRKVLQTLNQSSDIISYQPAHIARFNLTDSGLILMELTVEPQVLQEREELARRLANYRTGTAYGKYGYKYFDNPLHITVGSNINPSQFANIKEILEKTYISTQIALGPLEMYTNANWNTNHPIEIHTTNHTG